MKQYRVDIDDWAFGVEGIRVRVKNRSLPIDREIIAINSDEEVVGELVGALGDTPLTVCLKGNFMTCVRVARENEAECRGDTGSAYKVETYEGLKGKLTRRHYRVGIVFGGDVHWGPWISCGWTGRENAAVEQLADVNRLATIIDAIVEPTTNVEE